MSKASHSLREGETIDRAAIVRLRTKNKKEPGTERYSAQSPDEFPIIYLTVEPDEVTHRGKTMHPNKRTLHEFICKTDGFFQIPDFQRPYTWGNDQTSTFLSDLKKVAEKKNTHYFGTIVLIKENDYSVIIDGQQRLTTSLLFMNAVHHVLKNCPSKSVNFTAERVKEHYLINSYSSNVQHREKITLRTVTTDNAVLEKIFSGEELDNDEKANKLFKAHAKFKLFLESEDNVDSCIDALKKFEIVEISLDSSDDNPQSVFESINSTGEPLSAGDKIRNWALMLSSEEARKTVYDGYWKKIENKLTRVEKGKQVDFISDFFRTYLMCKKSVFVSDADTYPSFKDLLNEKISGDDIESIKVFYDDVLKHLLPYLSIKFMERIPGFEAFDERIFSLKCLQTETVNAFAVNLFVDFIDGKLTQEEVIKSLFLIEVFLARRIVCGHSTEGYNRIFSELYKAIRTKQGSNPGKTFDDCLSARLMEGRGRTIVMPNDAEINNSIPALNFYSNKSYQQLFVLAKICDQSKESTLLHNIFKKQVKLTVEHVMPQTMTPQWEHDLGNNWEQVHNKWVHSLANLTLTAYNSKLSNKSFSEKKMMKDGFSKSPLLLNQYIATFDKWDEEALEKRTKWLSEQITSIWKYPQTTLPLSDKTDVADSVENIEVNIFEADSPTGKNLDYFEFFDERSIPKDVTDFFIKVLRELSERHPEAFYNSPTVKKIITSNSKSFRSQQPPVKMNDSVFIKTHGSSMQKFEIIKSILSEFGYEEELIIKYS